MRCGETLARKLCRFTRPELEILVPETFEQWVGQVAELYKPCPEYAQELIILLAEGNPDA